MSRVLVYLCSEPIIIIGDEIVALRPHEAQIADVLSRARGEWVPTDKIIGHVWQPDEEPEDAEGNVSVHIHHLRKKIARYGVEIENRNRGDFRMVPG